MPGKPTKLVWCVVFCKGPCHACDLYLRRTGRERPLHLSVKKLDGSLARKNFVNGYTAVASQRSLSA